MHDHKSHRSLYNIDINTKKKILNGNKTEMSGQVS